MARRGINKVILVGNLGRDPEVRYLDQGVAVANFPLATSETFRTRDGNSQERTEWHNIVLWRGLAETAAKYLKKGSTVYLEGRIVTRSWEAEGVKKYRTEIEANQMVMLDSRPSEGGSYNEGPPLSAYNQGGSAQPATNMGGGSNPAPKAEVSAEDAADDLPF